MPVLTIDNREIEVAEGTSVLEAAKMLGIYIPHLCYHEGLSAVGSCRLCAVTFLVGPVKGVQMSCMVQAQDGMVVSTCDPAAQEMRRHVIEWLMTNHPHDCPVCDTGGECPLQEMTLAAGHAIRRYRGPKRTYPNQDLGPFVQQEMNRCIQCYRCVRTYQDVCGGTDFGAMGARQRVLFGRFREGRLESPFSGNLVDVCPTGVFTDKLFRFKARHWDLQEAPSICPSCSLGCSVIPGARYHELLRIRAGINPETNGHFICDRGRFSVSFTNHPQRPSLPLVNRNPVSWEEGLNTLCRRIEETIAEFGEGSVAFLGSARASLESNVLLRLWAERLGVTKVVFEHHPQRDRAARVVAARLGTRARSLKDLSKSDLILMIGADPVAEGPMSAPAIRKAVGGGAYAVIIDPRPVEVPFEADRLTIRPRQLAAVLKGLADGDFSQLESEDRDALGILWKRLGKARNPVLVGGVDLLGPEGVDLLIGAADSLSNDESRPCGAMVFLSGPNSFGAALLSNGSPTFDEIINQALENRLKVLICLENDFLNNYPDPGLAQAARTHLSLFGVIDYLPTASVTSADIFLPSAAPAEQEGVLVNNEGRMQVFCKVFEPGIPLRETGRGGFPPRVFESSQPTVRPREVWRILASILSMDESIAGVRREVERAERCFRGLSQLVPESGGLRITGSLENLPEKKPLLPLLFPEKSLSLIPISDFFGSGILAGFSETLETVRPEPYVFIHPESAEMQQISAGEKIRVVTYHGSFEVMVRISAEMSEDVVFLSYIRHSALNLFVPGGSPLPCTLEKLEKV
jgi:NADH-quinone oxidoreductase subunit G